ncbi:MAG: DUF1549 domain-containing protein [Planctomycetota bacterium]|nr:DUF1549 domain-containing protein [Planctomycetota bacterium]
MTLRLLACAGFLFVASSASLSADLLPKDREIHDVIDHYVSLRIKADKIETAEIAPDGEILRRLMLDLAGRIPTTTEVRKYTNLSESKHRQALVKHLLASPDYAYHLRNQLEHMLLGKYGSDGDLRDYLLEAARENRPWDRIFRDSIVGSEDDPKQKAALAFLKKRIGDVNDLTNDTSRIFFGVSINCAQCHDHPLVADWHQDHYFGFRAFLNRTYRTKKNTLAEKHRDELKFKTTEGKEKVAKIMFLTGEVVDEPKVEKSKEQIKKEDDEVQRQMKEDKAPAPTPPAFSPRNKLVEIALKRGDRIEPFFAKSIVNRTWARYFGRGMVDPLDQLHSANPASHPDLLAWLTRDFIDHGYDMQRLIGGIVLSRAYTRSSSWTGKGEPPTDSYFARAIPRVMTPRQYALSLIIATTSPKTVPDPTGADWAKHRENLENQSNGMAGQIETPTEHFQVSVGEALLFSNNDRIRNDYLRDSNDKLVGYLKVIDDTKTIINDAFLAVFSRSATSEELTAFEAYLTERSERRIDAIQQMVWALIASPEIRFVY